MLRYITHNPNTSSDTAVVWLHGLGASCDDFLSIIPYMRLPADLCVPIYFPQAPNLPVTINGGMRMPAWFDIRDFGFNNIPYDQVEKILAELDFLYQHLEQKNIKKFILVGFSQGGATALLSAATTKASVIGIASLSGYLPPYKGQLADKKIFLAHGKKDSVVPIQWAEHSYKALDTAMHIYDMEHEIIPEEAQDLGKFIAFCCSKK